MTPEVILGLINLGAAGAVIMVVGLFVKYLEKRDTILATSIEKVSTSVDANTKALVQLQVSDEGHYKSTEQMVKTVQEATRQCVNNTRPVKEKSSWS